MRCKICNREFQSFRELTEHLVKEHAYNAEDLYRYYDYSFETKEATCPICGKKFTMSWRQLKKHKDGIGKGITCGRACASVFMNLVYENPSCRPEVKEKKRQKALEKYGVENVFQAEEIKKKSKRTNLKKRGVEYAMQSSEVQNKSKETNLKNYGVEHVSQREDIKQRKIEKSIEKYGVENISQAQEIKDKKKEAALKKYGVEYTLQAPEVREKGIETNLEKYGFEYATQSPEVQNKTRETNLKNYGFEYAGQVPEFIQKSKDTNLDKYGVTCFLQTSEVKEIVKQNCLKKYGVENPFSSSEVRENIKQKFLEEYGVEYAAQIPEVQRKMKETNLKNYGVECVLQLPKNREKLKEANLKNYGVEWATQSPEVQERIKKKSLEKYGTENASQTPEAKKRRKKTNLKKYGVPCAFMAEEVKGKIKNRVKSDYGVEYFCQHEKCINANPHRISKINKKFHKLLLSYHVENELEFIIEDYGYDLKAGNVLIEIDPYFTHNSTVGPHFGNKEQEPISSDYHLMKTNFAKEHGYQCIHIFDWDDKDKVALLLKDRAPIHARKCKVKEINNKAAKEFLETYHLQGSTKQIKYAYGLYYEDELVQVMTFGKPRYNKNYEYELLRLCTKSKLTVVGGAQKLLKHFEKEVNPKSIISYCDLSKFSGEIYEKLGFKLISQTAPAKHWYNFKTKRHITDNLLRQRGFDQLHKANFGKGTSNEQLMLEHGYVEIYDCGQLVFTKEM